VLPTMTQQNYISSPWPFELQCKPPTLSSTASFGSGSVLLKGSCKSSHFKTFRCDVEAVVVFFRGQAKLHHSSTMAVRVTVKATDAFKLLSFGSAGILLKRSCKSHTFQDLSL
jgi:hypothetical protein